MGNDRDGVPGTSLNCRELIPKEVKLQAHF